MDRDPTPGRRSRPNTSPPGEGRRSRPELESEYPPVSQPGHDAVARERARQAHALADEAHDLAGHVASELQELHKMRLLLGSAPSPGVQGSGLVGAVVQMATRQEAMEAKIDRLLAARAPSDPPRRRSPPKVAAIVAVVTALTGGVVAIVSAVRGSAPPAHTPAGGTP